MKLRLTFALIAVTVAMLLSSCGGNVAHVNKYIGMSDSFTETEIDRAMDVVIIYFERKFDGCTLLKIEYDEEDTVDAASEWAEQYDADEAIVLTSSFEVGESGGNGSLNPNSTYNNWEWVLTRSHGGRWKLQTWGYG